MYCLKTYDKNQIPEKNLLLDQQLWLEANMKYGIKRSRQLLSNECNSKEFIFDIDCRRRHLMNLISLWNRFCRQTSSHPLIIDAQNMANKLLEIIRDVHKNDNGNMDKCKGAYRKVISTSGDDKDIGLYYIRLCEDLQLEISDAECYSTFPKTYGKLNKWMHQQGSANEFQPKIPNLFEAIEQDLINQWSDAYSTVRTKIGVIGYTSAGKSCVINRLLGVKFLTEDGAAPVSADKSTYFPLQYDRKEPFIHPDHRNRKTLVTLVDIQGLDKNRISANTEVEAGNYLDEIYKADCDIYILVHDEELSEEQQKWIICIEVVLKRKCVLVRSKVDIHYLIKFHEYTGTYFAMSEPEQQTEFGPTVIEQLRQDNLVESRYVYLVACDYSPSNSDAAMLLKKQPFDFPELLNQLSRLAFDACSHRIHALAHRTIARAINTIFRRGYILNVLKYKVAAGFASIIPFGDQLPRHLSRDDIRDAFGINDHLREYLKEFHLIIYNYKLQTSLFEDCVKIEELQNNSKLDTKWIGRTAGAALAVSGGFADDILRVAMPVATAATGAARIVFTVATIGIGVAISAGVSAWSAVESGKHIFSYTNRACDDIIMITNPLISSIIEREREKVFGNSDPTVPTSDNVQNK
jgi:GTPase SAR1 family protein